MYLYIKFRIEKESIQKKILVVDLSTIKSWIYCNSLAFSHDTTTNAWKNKDIAHVIYPVMFHSMLC